MIRAGQPILQGNQLVSGAQSGSQMGCILRPARAPDTDAEVFSRMRRQAAKRSHFSSALAVESALSLATAVWNHPENFPEGARHFWHIRENASIPAQRGLPEEI